MIEPSASIGVTVCDGPGLKRLAAAGLAWLEQHYESVNQLNVFPVPDGDTGTNMLLTMRAAYREIANLETRDASVVADKLAYGAVMGSRGNSGTILSQLLRGFAQAAADKRTIGAVVMALGFREAVKMAYKAVQSPVEGTILTVAREAAEEVEIAIKETNDLTAILDRAVTRANAAVSRTPDMLPILKKAGVVDSGGKGLAIILEGMLRHARGEVLNAAMLDRTEPMTLHEVLQASDSRGYGYDVQYILRGKNLDLDAVRAAIGSMGDSMVVVGDSSLIKVHIHVHDPGIPISYGANLGVISDVVVENMQEQSQDYIARRAGESEPETAPDERPVTVNEGDIAVVAVVPGDGLRRVFRDLGAAFIVSGGQTMNPSTEELFNAVQSLNTDKVIILPNNKNVILSAEQAAALIRAESPNCNVTVIPTRTVPQGIAAILALSPTGDLDSVVEAMQEARQNVITGEVTTATRSVELDGVNVEAGQVIGLIDSKLAVSGSDLAGLVHDLLDKMGIRDRELVTLYYGENVTQEQADALGETLRQAYPEQEFDVIRGGQPHYQYLVSAE
ncbi:MAG: DAK2 domain-containing protein [Anaerolineae bacterium]|nr:DAK2 domain-containing protein [Anaerolineae bacterium]